MKTEYNAADMYRREQAESYRPGNTPASVMNRMKDGMIGAMMGDPMGLVKAMPGFSPRVANWPNLTLEERCAEAGQIVDKKELSALLAIEPTNTVLDALLTRKRILDPDPSEADA